MFVDSTSAIDRIRSDKTGPSQRFSVAAIEACTRVLARHNEASIRWVPAHHGVLGNEKADEYAKAAAEGEEPDSEVSDQYRWEASLSHTTRVARPGPGRLPGGRQIALEPPDESTAPPWKGAQARAPPKSAKVRRQPVLPAPVRPRGNRPVPEGQG